MSNSTIPPPEMSELAEMQLRIDRLSNQIDQYPDKTMFSVIYIDAKHQLSLMTAYRDILKVRIARNDYFLGLSKHGNQKK